MLSYPTKYIITSGIGKAAQKLVSFDNALLSAGIANYNLLKVSSILPIGCTKVQALDKKLGSALLTAYGSISSNKKGETISSAVAVGIPENDSHVGVIMEFSGYCSSAEAEETVRKMVTESMQNHNIPCNKIEVSSAEVIVDSNDYVTVISALSMW